MHQYNVGAPFERISIDVAGSFPHSDQENRNLLIAMDYLPSGQKPTSFPTKRLQQWRKRWLPTSFVAWEYRGSYVVVMAVTSSIV
jgi:hypothetical protein